MESEFKETEIGLIPEDWEIDTLGNLFNIQQGKSLSPKSRKGISPRPFLRTANVLWGKIDLSKLDQMDFSASETEKLALKTNDLLVCEGGDIGRTAIWEKQIPLCLYQNHLHRLRVNRTDIVSRFFMYWMQAALTLLGLYEGAGNRTTIPNLSRSRLSSFIVPVPSKEEQEAVVVIMQKLQQAIAQQEQIIAKTKELKQSLMHRLFTYGLRGENQKETDAGTMPINWEVVSLGNICTYTTGKLNSNAAKENGQYPFFTCSQETYKIDSYSFDQEALLLAGNNARAIYSVKYYKGKFDAYQRTYVFTIKEKCIYKYLLYELTRKLEMLRISSLGTTTKYITAGIISNLQIALPALDEQKEIAIALQSIDDKINFETNRKNYLSNLFKTVLQLLMTGQVRVKDIDFDGIDNDKDIKITEGNSWKKKSY